MAQKIAIFFLKNAVSMVNYQQIQNAMYNVEIKQFAIFDKKFARSVIYFN